MSKPTVRRARVHLHIYHRLPRMRLAMARGSVEAVTGGLGVRRISLECRVDVPFRRVKDGRIVIPARYVEAYGLKPCHTYEFCFYLAYRIMKVKIRLYNEAFRAPSPRGMFQGFYLVTVPVDEYGMPVWEHPITRELVDECKRDFVSYWRGQPVPYEKTLLAWMRGREAFDDKGHPVETSETVPFHDLAATYRRIAGVYAPYMARAGEPYARNVPDEFIEMAERLTIGEVVEGLSAVIPSPAIKDELGAWREEMMVIKEEEIVWHESFKKKHTFGERRVEEAEVEGIRIYPAEELLSKFKEWVQSFEDVVVEERRRVRRR